MVYNIEPCPGWRREHEHTQIAAATSKEATTFWAKQVYGDKHYAVPCKVSSKKSIYGYDSAYYYIHQPVPGGSVVVDRVFARALEMLVAH